MDVVLTEDGRGHTAYADLIAHPPDGVRYVLRPLTWGAPIHDSRWRDALAWKARGARRLVEPPPHAIRVPDWGAPVHSTQAVLRSPRPYVAGFEHPGVFVEFEYERLNEPATRRRIGRLLRRTRCRGLLAWTEAAAQAMRVVAPDAADLVRVVRPAISPRAPAEPDADAPLVLFVGRYFERKGGLEAVEAFARARERASPNARMIVVSNASPDVVDLYRGRGVEFLPVPQPRARVFEFFSRATAFLMPSHYDTFGMVFLEAFSHAVPVVTADTFAADEIVTDGVDGFIARGYSTRWFREDGTPTPGLGRWEALHGARDMSERERIVEDLADRLARLLADPALARRMGARGLEKVTSGPYSVGERNAALSAVYRDAFQ